MSKSNPLHAFILNRKQNGRRKSKVGRRGWEGKRKGKKGKRRKHGGEHIHNFTKPETTVVLKYS